MESVQQSSGQPSPTDLAQIDAALRLLDREIWIITAADGDRRGGLVATWVSSASIDRQRPMLLAGIGPNHFTAELVQATRVFGAHLLRTDQTQLAWNFAREILQNLRAWRPGRGDQAIHYVPHVHRHPVEEEAAVLS